MSGARAERSDPVLVAAAREGDAHAFEELMDRYEGKVYNLALRITGSPEDALDATQEAFLKVYENLDRYDPRHRFFSWIYRIGLNEALDRVGARSRFVEWEVDIEAEPAPGPEQRTHAREVGRAIQEALLGLTPELRAPVVLRHFHGLSYAQMAEVIGIPAKTVKSRLYSARQELRRELTRRGLTGDEMG